MEIDRIMKLVFGLMSMGLLSGSLFVEEIGILFIIGAVILLALIHVLDAIVDRKIGVEKPAVTEVKPVVAEVKPTVPGKVEPVPVVETPIATPKPPKPEAKAEEKKVFKCKHCGKEFEEEKKLRRHFGMAHYDKLDI